MIYKIKPMLFLSIFLLLTIMSFSQSIPEDSLYLGQSPPGITPIKFQLPVVSGLFAAERIAISADSTKIYYSELNAYPFTVSKINCFQYANNKWNGPIAVSQNYMAPALSIDGNILYCEDNNNNPQSFYSTRTDTSWSTPSKFLSTLKMSHYFQETNPGNYYVTSSPLISSGSQNPGDISELTINAADTSINDLGVPLNASNNDQDFYISKNESYVITVRLVNGVGSMFVSYHKADGTWTNPKTLGSKINFQAYEWGPYVTSDNKYLFFSAQESASNYQTTTFVYWARIDSLIESLKYTDYAPYAKWNIASQTATKGVLFNFTVPDSTFYDDDNDSLTYSATLSNGNPLPGWLSFNPITRTFSGTPVSTTNKLNPLEIEVIASDPSHESGSCVFSLSVSNPTGVKENNGPFPKKLQLLQNYPNPFNPSTIISYYLANASHVTLTIYNMLGQKIRTLQNEFQSSGEYSVSWNGMDNSNKPVSSGVYFYKLLINDPNGETGNIIMQRKMVCVK
jgi:hypothetical protein